jgi:hypothetical protein
MNDMPQATIIQRTKKKLKKRSPNYYTLEKMARRSLGCQRKCRNGLTAVVRLHIFAQRKGFCSSTVFVLSVLHVQESSSFSLFPTQHNTLLTLQSLHMPPTMVRKTAPKHAPSNKKAKAAELRVSFRCEVSVFTLVITSAVFMMQIHVTHSTRM